MGSLSPVHWLIVAVVVLLVFGPSRLATAGKGLGEGLRAFRLGLSDEESKASTSGGSDAETPNKKRDS